MRSQTDDLEAITIFVRTVVTGSLSAAAAELGISVSTVSKKLARFEDSLGVMLLHRTSRTLTLTEAGREFYETCSECLTQIRQAQEAATEFSSEARGVLRVLVGQGFGRTHVVPLIPAFLERHDKIVVDIRFLSASESTFKEGIDVILSPYDPPDSNLVVRALFPFARVTCATRAYVEEHGRPQSLEDLRNHNCLIYIKPQRVDSEWTFRVPGGQQRLRVSGNFRTNNHEALHVALMKGLGIAQLPYHDVSEEIRSGELVVLFSDERDAGGTGGYETMNAYYPQAKNRMKKVTVFLDFLVEHFRRDIAFSGALQED